MKQIRDVALVDDAELDKKVVRLRAHLEHLDSVLVCYSGGLDSGFLLAIAHAVLGNRAVAMTAAGPALAPAELQEASALAHELGARIELVDAGEIDDPGYVANTSDRCFHCKKSLYLTAKRVAAELGLAAIANGTNTDDLDDFRPGLDAAHQYGIKSPLLECGFNKSEIRRVARAMGLSLWDKPAAACLASRIPYGTEVTRERLSQVAGFEHDLKALGFARLRVRHHGAIARIEVDTQDIARLASSPTKEAVVEAGKRNGYTYITVDLAGYRTGSHNEVLVGKSLKTIA
jgi:uncharacterized protein